MPPGDFLTKSARNITWERFRSVIASHSKPPEVKIALLERSSYREPQVGTDLEVDMHRVRAKVTKKPSEFFTLG